MRATQKAAPPRRPFLRPIAQKRQRFPPKSPPSCENTHGNSARLPLRFPIPSQGSTAISKEQPFTDCVVLEKDAFDPDAVFLDDIVDDEVLPRLSLAVDGLTGTLEGRGGRLELPAEAAANEPMPPSMTLPVAEYDPEQLEVYGWESSLWRKVRGYLGF